MKRLEEHTSSSKKGVFWIIDGELLAVPFSADVQYGIAKSGTTYNHRLLWEHVKPEKCNKPYDYYPRGRVEIDNRGRPVIYMNPYVGMEMLAAIKEAFGLTDDPIIHIDGSRHYYCFLDKTQDKHSQG